MFGLLNKSKKADHAEFERVAMVHADALYGAALRMTRDAPRAEDLVQETLLRAFRFWHKFEQGTNAKAWLFRVQTNLFINRYRKRQTEQKVLDDREIDDLLNRFAADDHVPHLPPDTRAEFLTHVVGDEVMHALEQLPFEFRMCVLLADMHDFSYKEIAEVLDCPVGTVMSRLHRARKLLQAQLFQYAVDRGVIHVPGGMSDDNVADLDQFRRRKASKSA
jgi:RNA polymerase sigma-70 factor (ECF subfamily)